MPAAMTTKGEVAWPTSGKPNCKSTSTCAMAASGTPVTAGSSLPLSSSVFSLPASPDCLRISSQSRSNVPHTREQRPFRASPTTPSSVHDPKSPHPVPQRNRSIPEPGSRHSDAPPGRAGYGADEATSSESLSWLRSAPSAIAAPRTAQIPARTHCNVSRRSHSYSCRVPASFPPPAERLPPARKTR